MRWCEEAKERKKYKQHPYVARDQSVPKANSLALARMIRPICRGQLESLKTKRNSTQQANVERICTQKVCVAYQKLATCKHNVNSRKYPFVEGIEVSAGKGYCDVTIYGLLSHGFHISDVQIMIFEYDIILVPIATAGLKGGDIHFPFEKTVHIEDLDSRRYTISIIGWREEGERILITETVEIE